MAITYNNPQSASSTGTPLSLSYTVSSGSDQILVVGICGHDNPSAMVVSSVTYDGDSLTSVADNDFDDGGEIYHSQLFERLAPSVTTANITSTLSSGTPEVHILMAQYFNGAKNQTAEASAIEDDGTSPMDVAVTTLTDNAGIAVALMGADDSAWSPITDTTEDLEVDPGVFDFRAAMGHRTGGSAGSHTLGWTGTPLEGGALAIAAWEEAGAAAANPKGPLGGLVFGGALGGPVG